MRLYHSPMAVSLACRLALTAGDAKYDISLVNSLAGETKQEPFLSTNPLGEIPVLECDGTVLTQALAILTFIAERTGHGWDHPSALDRAEALSIMTIAAVEVQGAWRMVNRPTRYADSEIACSELRSGAIFRLDAAHVEIERRLGSLDGGRNLGILDYYLSVFALWKAMTPVGADLSATPFLDEVKDRVMSAPDLRRVVDQDIADYTALAGPE